MPKSSAPEGPTDRLPWAFLHADLPDGVIPGLVGDANTAMWNLQTKVDPEVGDEITYRDERGEIFRVRLVGKLPMPLSVFQGTILISREDFMERYPSEAGYRMFLADVPEGTDPAGATVDLDAAKSKLGTPEEGVIEAPDLAGITTVQEYAYVPQEKLPPVQGVSGYEWDEENKVVKFPINMWIGWLPIVAANGGFAPTEDSIFYKEHGFKVDLTLIDDPVVACS